MNFLVQTSGKSIGEIPVTFNPPGCIAVEDGVAGGFDYHDSRNFAAGDTDFKSDSSLQSLLTSFERIGWFGKILIADDEIRRCEMRISFALRICAC